MIKDAALRSLRHLYGPKRANNVTEGLSIVLCILPLPFRPKLRTYHGVLVHFYCYEFLFVFIHLSKRVLFQCFNTFYPINCHLMYDASRKISSFGISSSSVNCTMIKVLISMLFFSDFQGRRESCFESP